MQIKTYEQFISLFEIIAASHKQIGHTLNEPKYFENVDLYIASSGTKGKHLVLGWSQSRFIDRKSDNIIKQVTFELWILEIAKSQNKADQMRILQETEQIAIDILSYFKKMVEEYPSLKQIYLYQPDGIVMEPMGPVGQNAFGTSLQIIIGNPESLDFDATKWNS